MMVDETPVAPRQHYRRSYFFTGNYGKRGRGRFSMYWFARRYYAALVKRFAPAEQTALLELGCGLGHLLGLLQDDFRCTGIDLIDYAVEQTRRNAPLARVIHGDAEATERFSDGEFGVVVALHLIEHLPRPQAMIREVNRMLQPGGLWLFATPHPGYALRRFKDPTRDAAGKDPTHINVHPPAVWRCWCEDSGFSIVRHFGDGLWDVPYVPLLPAKIQFALFGFPALIQVLTRATFMPLSLGVNQIVIARKSA